MRPMKHIYMKRVISALTALTVFSSLSALPANANGVGDSLDDSKVSANEISRSLYNVKSSSNLIMEASHSSTLERLVSNIPNDTDIPQDASEGMSIAGISVSLPNAEAADKSVSLPDGTVVYPSQGNSANAVVANSSGVQVLTTIANKNADTHYEYELQLEEHQTLALTSDGGAAVYNGDGSVQVVVPPAWAQDANGHDIPTRYVVENNRLIQIVEHTSVQNVAYPVVADPIWLAPWVVRCLIGIGINGPTIVRIASTGTPQAILAAFGYAAFRCVIGR